MNVLRVLVLLVLTSTIQLTLRAQQPILEVEGKAKITEMDEISSSEKVVVRLPDGTLAELPIANLAGGCSAFGDGSAGDLIIDDTMDWAANPPVNGNYMFKNLTINSGLILFVSSGTIIKVLDTFINNGIIVVDAGILGAEDSFSGNGRSTEAGYSRFLRFGINKESLRSQFQPGPIAGSSGGSGSGDVTGKISGGGGGTLIIKARKNLVNNGIIAALGRNGADLSSNMTNVGGPGGGGGGFIILMSGGNIENADTILAIGGNGGEPGTSGFAGGGGGGGLIHLISPNANSVTDGLIVQGGSKGVSMSLSGSAGGHGGGSIGDGGLGGFDFPTSQEPENGQPGAVLRTQVANVCALIGN